MNDKIKTFYRQQFKQLNSMYKNSKDKHGKVLRMKPSYYAILGYTEALADMNILPEKTWNKIIMVAWLKLYKAIEEMLEK